MKQVTVNQNDASQRLDKFITKYMPKLPKGMLYKGLRKNCVRVNNKHMRDGGYILQEGDILSLYFKDEFFSAPASFTPKKHELNIVYEDKNILLINKPAGVVSHADDKNTARTLIDEIKSYLYEKGEYSPDIEHSFSPALCNRLDRNTAGLIIAAKNAHALRIINEKIKNREIRKLYLCIVDGHPPRGGIISNYLTKNEKRVSLSDIKNENSRLAQTKYSVLSYGKDNALVEAELLTGRTHQIRAQLASIGHPLTGDVKYGGSKNGFVSLLKGTQNRTAYTLLSHRLIFDFKTDAGVLNYLTGKDFSVPSRLFQSFSQANS